MPSEKSRSSGKVFLIGAGPGDPGLITLRGAERLKIADVVLYDYLVNPQILDHCRNGCEKICLRSHGSEKRWNQEEINAKLIEYAREGKTVARLKGGDPAVFARGVEEVVALSDAGISYEIVPGVTVALAAGSYAGIPITHRDLASAVALVTGQENFAKGSSSLDFEALARFPGTLVFYMGVTTVESWTQQLMAAGKSPDTPVAIVRRCSFPDQKTVHCTLDEVAERLTPRSRIPPPVIVIVGKVAELGPALSWFEKRPLFGQTVLVTRAQHQARELGRMFEEQGAEVIYQPAIEIAPPDDWDPVDEAIRRLRDYDWLVFSSSNGVRFFFDRLLQSGHDLRALAQSRIAVVGPGTRETLRGYHLQADLLPASFRAESLVEELASQVAGQRVLLLRASRGREVLSDGLRSAGATVDQRTVYQSTDRTEFPTELLERLDAGQVDWVTVTSSAIAQSLSMSLGPHLTKTRLASISPITTDQLVQSGLAIEVEADPYTMDGLVSAICAAAPTLDD